MSVEQRTWGGQIPILQNHSSQLLSLSNDIISSHVEPYDKTDLLGVMADVFMQKLTDHLKSILVLVDAGQYQDATIIARSSYESMGLLLWSANGPKENFRESRPLQWFAYEFIDRYYQMERYRQLGIEPDPETEKTIRQGVQEYADLFLTKDASRAIRQGKAPKRVYLKIESNLGK